MKSTLFFAIAIGLGGINAVADDAAAKAVQERVCKSVTKGLISENDTTADSLKETNGTPMPTHTKLPDASEESGISGYAMDGEVGSYNALDFYYAKHMLFFRYKGVFNPDDPNEKNVDPDKDPEAGYYKLDRDTLPENGLICPTSPKVYQHFWVAVRAGDLLCVKRAHGNFFGVIYIQANCPNSNTIVFSSTYKSQEVPTDQINVVFPGTTAPAQSSVIVPSKR